MPTCPLSDRTGGGEYYQWGARLAGLQGGHVGRYTVARPQIGVLLQPLCREKLKTKTQSCERLRLVPARRRVKGLGNRSFWESETTRRSSGQSQATS